MKKKVVEKLKKSDGKAKTVKTDPKPKTRTKKVDYNKLLKPYMDFLGILNYEVFPLEYYKGENELYIIETDYLETFILKIFHDNAYKYSASIEKHFISNAKNISKLTSSIQVAHDEEKKLKQFLFTDRLPGANKKWDAFQGDDKSEAVHEIAKTLYKIHTYTSVRIMKDTIYGRVATPFKTWNSYLKDFIEKKTLLMREKKIKESEIKKLEKLADSKLAIFSTHKINPSLLHGSVNLNEQLILRSFLFLGNKISAILNSEESIYGDRIWDLVKLHTQILSKNETLEKEFFRIYGKLSEDEKERLEFYKAIVD